MAKSVPSALVAVIRGGYGDPVDDYAINQPRGNAGLGVLKFFDG